MFRILLGMILSAICVSAVADGNPVRGKDLTATCVACHGEDGNSLAGSFPSIAGQQNKYLLKQMREIQSGVRAAPLMAGQLDAMSDQDLQDMAAFYAEQTAKGGAAKAELVELGETVYRTGVKRKGIAACTACHQPDGSGMDGAAFPGLAGQWPEYTVSQLKAFRDGSRDNDGDGKMMRTIAMDLSDGEMEAVASFLYGLK